MPEPREVKPFKVMFNQTPVDAFASEQAAEDFAQVFAASKAREFDCDPITSRSGPYYSCRLGNAGEVRVAFVKERP